MLKMLGVANTRAEAQTTAKDHRGNQLTPIRNLWVLAFAAVRASCESWEDHCLLKQTHNQTCSGV